MDTNPSPNNPYTGPVHRYIGLDPGVTTGYASAYHYVETKQVIINALKGWHPTGGAKGDAVDFDSTDTLAFYFEKLSAALFQHAGTTYVAIEDFVGGRGGNLQNFICKLIGGFIHDTLIVSRASSNIYPASVYVNMSRRSFLEQARSIAPKGTSIHAIDALAHLLHKIKEINPKEKFAELTFTVLLD